MSFCMENLSVLAYANGFTLWHYRAAADGLPDVLRAGYFSSAADVVADGDMMMVNGAGAAGMICLALDEGQVSVRLLGG